MVSSRTSCVSTLTMSMGHIDPLGYQRGKYREGERPSNTAQQLHRYVCMLQDHSDSFRPILSDNRSHPQTDWQDHSVKADACPMEGTAVQRPIAM